MRIPVVAGVMEDARGRVLVTQRPAGKAMAGAWEFPGGKLRPDEAPLDALVRELDEELGVRVDAARPLIRYRHHYPELEIDLDTWRVERWSGEPQSREGQAFAWHDPQDLLGMGLLPADAAIVRAIRLPDVIRVTPPEAVLGESAFLDALERAAGDPSVLGRIGFIRERTPVESKSARTAPELICLRRPLLEPAAILELAVRAARRLEGTGTRLILHGDPFVLAHALLDEAGPLSPGAKGQVAGLHIAARQLRLLDRRPVPAALWFGASCHDACELAAALTLDADYAFLGPVRPTASHPNVPGIGWDGFAALVAGLPLPVYAIGGLNPDDLEAAWKAGAQGVAGIRGLWPAPDCS